MRRLVIGQGRSARAVTLGEMVKVGDKWVPAEFADAVRAGTYQEAIDPKKRKGRPRVQTSEGGVHLILFPTFSAWLKNRRPDLREQWSSLSDRRKYFIMLAVASVSEDNAFSAAYCQQHAPELTKAALPMLKRRWRKVTPDDYAAACSNPSYGTASRPRVMSARERERRQKTRRALEMFNAATE